MKKLKKYTVSNRLIYNSGCLLGLDKSFLYGHLDISNRIEITGYETALRQNASRWTQYYPGKAGFSPDAVKYFIDGRIDTEFDVIEPEYSSPSTDSNGYQVRCVSESSPIK